MRLPNPPFTLLSLLLSTPTLTLAQSRKAPLDDPRPCTAHSSSTGSFFDLNPISLHPPSPSSKKQDKTARSESWHARGYDYHANFTLNFCAPVVEDLWDVKDFEGRSARNVSAFYRRDGEVISIGSSNYRPIVRGRKLVLNYTDGSYCAPLLERRSALPGQPKPLDPRARDDPSSNSSQRKRPSSPSPSSRRRKSTLISLLCERDPMAAKATVNFVGTDPDECTYMFEARSPAACPAVNQQRQSLGPSGVFGIIALIAILAYLLGGIFYQRIVLHQRGWRQLPNYSLWAGMFTFARDVVVIVVSTVSRCLPRGLISRFSGGGKPGYGRANGAGPNGFAGAARGEGDENRLIDQLDESWED